MCDAIFDKGGLLLPLENVKYAERMPDGRVRVYMKDSNGESLPMAVAFLSKEHADEFEKALKDFHQHRHEHSS